MTEETKHATLPRWVLERAQEEFVAMAVRTGCQVDQKAADMIARVLGGCEDEAFTLYGNGSHARAFFAAQEKPHADR